jgi:signal transduction histidine kinase
VKKFAAEMSGESPGTFLSAVEDVLRHVIVSDGNTDAWQGALSALRRHTRPYLHCEEDVSKAEDLWNQARVAIGEVAQRGQAHRTFQSNRQAQFAHDISQVLSTTPDINALGDVVARRMPDLGIPSCYLSLYEDPSAPTGWSRLILAYDRANAQHPDARIALEPGGRQFPSQQLVPADLLPQNRQYSVVVLPLFFGEEQLGFVLFEAGPREGDVYQTLHISLAGALHSARLLQQVTSRGLQLQTAAEVSHAATSILAPAKLIQQIVDLACSRFDLYYVGLFLVNTDEGDPAGGPARSWAVLQAGTGEAGRKMLEQGYRLEVGGGSVIGRCVAEGRAIIALDVGKKAVHFGNPLLPETHSEVVLPLTNRGKVIGALSIQSTQEAAFDEEDTAVFQTMANQLANAIANARLYDQAQQEIAERKQAEEALRQRTLELEAQNAELDAFAHTVAHDLKSPLSAMILLSTMLEEQFEKMASEKVKDTLLRISQTGYTSANIIDELLLLSSVRKEDVQLEPLDMASIVAEAQERLIDMLVEYQAEVSRAAEWPVALGHAPWVQEIWVNYISNAVKYGGWPEQGVPPRIELGFDSPSNAHVRFWVRDNGPGLALEEQAQLFAPFTRLHQVRAGGHGLGLSIVQRIAERLGGEVGVESEVGQGSMFYFTLPTTARKVPGYPGPELHLPLEVVAASASQLVDQVGYDGPVRPAWRR